jgi:hypothetical protein
MMKVHVVEETKAKKRFLTQQDLLELAEVISAAVNAEIAIGRHISKDTILKVLEKKYGKD